MTEKLWSFRVAQAQEPDAAELEVLRKRFTSAIVILLPLSDGRFAILGSDRQLHCILSDAPSAEEWTRIARELEAKSRALHARAEGAFYGEPSDRDLARDLKRAHAQAQTPEPVGALDW